MYKRFSFVSFLFYTGLFITTSCSDEPNNRSIAFSQEAYWSEVESQGLSLPVFVSVPEGIGPFPTVMVLHGCGGLVKSLGSKDLETHFQHWIDYGITNKVVMVFPDSFSPRGFSEFCNMLPPGDAVCSPAYERTKDVYSVLDWLSSQPFADINRVGLLGFSHGGSTALSAVHQTSNEHRSKIWTVRSNGVTYEVPAPTDLPEGLSFKAVSVYYPGAGFYGYFNDTYRPIAPIQIHAAELDPLYTSGNVETLIETAGQNATNNPVELFVYGGAAHSFDGASSGPDLEANIAARKRTMEWFSHYLSIE
jgi:dienelactone hydrolase